ncbi:GAP family protein [Conexibacter sp. JD483]|uniref:GAP family protein n=1 Tax=unclassified Conexibacter TaxID=2627773 RepID=UPI002718E8FB|nr:MULTISPECIES: GAP family protein [unclassified Conexibacter]MDO8186565.1 GAP family protein [Conexibacter sp. CPCC 205706]MDO8196670.1 GAP family protein [Conexibacter sp. CPCC 205762]MDR9372044.1 GAP family protein [Conexibacter sp. JD483]
MLNGVTGDLLPSAVAVALSPFPIVAIVLTLGTPRARVTGSAFALGWIAGLALLSTLVVLVLGSGVDAGVETGIDWFDVVVGAGFLLLAARTWAKRPRDGEQPPRPGWMDSLGSLTPPRALVTGAALSGANPKNLALTIAVSASVSEAALDPPQTAIALVLYVCVGSFTVVGPLASHLLAGERAAAPLAAVERFISAHSSAIMIVILLLLGTKLLGDGLGGL